MKIYRYIQFMTILFLLWSTVSVFGQSVQEIEKELVKKIKTVNQYSSYGDNTDYDKLTDANADFKDTLLKYTANNPKVLQNNFDDLSKNIFISTSTDGKFRIYSWDTLAGGTMHFFENVYQFIGDDGKVYSTADSNEEGDPGGFYSGIYTLDTKNGTVYIARQSSILSTSLAGQTVMLFKIEDAKLNRDYKLFKTGSGMQNSIGFSYDFFSVVDRPERPIKLILYNEKKKEIKIPIVIEDDKTPQGRVTNRFILYRFNGKYFERVKR